jgi:hypothetical protein
VFLISARINVKNFCYANNQTNHRWLLGVGFVTVKDIIHQGEQWFIQWIALGQVNNEPVVTALNRMRGPNSLVCK